MATPHTFATIHNMKTSILIAFIAAVAYVLTYTLMQGYYGREVSTQEIALSGIIFFLAFAGAHAIVTHFRKK